MRTISSELAALEQAQLRRRLRSPSALINFSSNDYLGLSWNEELRSVFQQAVVDHGVGAGASRLVSGTHQAHLELEAALAAFKGTEAALTFSSGYAAAVGALGALLRPGDIVLLDKLCHASLVDGAKLSGATMRVFPHNDMDKLGSHLEWANRKRQGDTRVLVITESVFSMDGDRSPLEEIVRLKKQAGAWLMVDEAHAVGILGEHGSGLANALQVGREVDIHLGTLSKAVGLSGGYVCGTSEMIDLLINRARSFIYSTAPPPAVAAAATWVITKLLPSTHGRQLRRQVWENLDCLTKAIPGMFPAPQSAILPWIIGSEASALAMSQRLETIGYLIPAIRYPTVPKGKARLRISVNAAHTEKELLGLAKEITAVRNAD